MGRTKAARFRSGSSSRRYDCSCGCSGCNNARESGFGHCHNRSKGCHFGEDARDDSRALLVNFDLWDQPKEEYKVSILCLDPADQREMNDLTTLTAHVDAIDARRAAEVALNKLRILWQGSDGEYGSRGIGPFGYLLCDRETNVHTLVWAHDEVIARELASIPDRRVRYCTLVTVEKIPYAM